MKRRIVLPEVEAVKLPVLFNMRPGVYLFILYAILLIVILFCVAYLPGILKGGRYVTFSAPLAETGIVLDGTYLGATDNQYFIASGEHEVAYMKGGVQYATYALDVDHPVFLTWFFHRTKTVDAPQLALGSDMKFKIIHFDLEQIQQASAILTYDAVTRYEPVFSNLVSDLKSLDIQKETFEQALELALLYITNETMLLDAQQALQKYQIALTAFMQQTLESATSLFATANASTGLSEKVGSLVKKETSLQAGEFEIPGYRYPQASFVMGTLTGQNYPAINEAGIKVTTPSFALSTYEVSQYQWALFLQENPMWEKANLASLVEQGLVDEAYLAGLSPSTIFVTNKPIHTISYFAAQAFCEWLSSKTGKTVFLPSESMWTIAAYSHSNLKFDASLSPIPSPLKEPVSLLGGVWELTQTPYIPLARITDYQKALALHESFGLTTQPIVKGGSYLNDAKTISSNTVGVVDPDVCGDLIGFRVAWYE